MTATELFGAEATDPDCIADGEQLLAGNPWARMVVVGDSVAAGVREPLPGYRHVSLADRVAAAVGAAHDDFAYVNLAIPFATAAEVRDVQLDEAVAFSPDLAFVIAGGNDALAPDFDEAQVAERLREILRPLADAGALVVTIGLFDLARSGLVPERKVDLLTDRFDRLDDLTRRVVREVGGLHVDTHHHPRSADPAIYSSDRIHANDRGHAIAAAAILRTLAPEVRPRPRAPGP